MENKFLNWLFGNRGDAAASMNSRVSGITYPKWIRLVALGGIVFGAICIWAYLNWTWLHWPGTSMLFLLSAVALWWLCFMMMTIGVRSVISNLMWLGVAIAIVSVTFLCLHWPGGGFLAGASFTYLFVVLCAIGYLIHLPQEYNWVKRPLGWWLIAPQILWIIIYWCRRIIWTNVYNSYGDFEPAIPYSYESIMWEQAREYENLLMLAYGLSILPFSIWLYIVAKRQCKKTGK